MDSGADIANLEHLDLKLWVALACPTTGVEFDAATLTLIDLDGDKRIRASELLAAVAWIRSVLIDTGDLLKRSSSLPLSAISEATPEGRAVKASALQVLKNLGKFDATEITLAETSDTAKIFGATRFNGDGVVPPDAAGEPETRAVMEAIIAALGGVPDRSGKVGVNKEKVDAFGLELTAYSDWWAKIEANPHMVPVGEGSHGAADVLASVQDKIDDYFTRSRLAAFDSRAAEHLGRSVDDWKLMASRALTSGDAGIRDFPLARIEAGRALPLAEGVNPAWSDVLTSVRQKVVAPLLGDRTKLTAEEWSEIRGRFAGYMEWRASKAGVLVESLGLASVREILARGTIGTLRDLVTQDEALRAEAESLTLVERAIRYHQHLFTLLENFVSFRDFYSRKAKAIFQSGTLYLDGRACELCLVVDDMAKHGLLAGLSQLYLAYCECTRKASGEKMTMAVAFTGGDSDFLMVGRNGIFYDRQGKDWDATIIKVVENPISIRQAFWSPYKRIGKLISDQIEKFASSRDKAMQERAAAQVATGAPVTAPSPAPVPVDPNAGRASAFDVAKFAGIFAAIGLALGALASAFAAIAGSFMGLRLWQMPLALLGVVILISGPSMLMAVLKLRQRNLGPLLDASGWAINSRARINIPFGASLTSVAEVPASARIAIPDPFAEKKRPVWLYVTIGVIIALLALAWDLGLKKYLGLN